MTGCRTRVLGVTALQMGVSRISAPPLSPTQDAGDSPQGVAAPVPQTGRLGGRTRRRENSLRKRPGVLKGPPKGGCWGRRCREGDAPPDDLSDGGLYFATDTWGASRVGRGVSGLSSSNHDSPTTPEDQANPAGDGYSVKRK